MSLLRQQARESRPIWTSLLGSWLLGLWCIGAVTACDGTPEISQAKTVVSGFYSALQGGDFDQAVGFYSEKALSEQGREAFLAEFAENKRRLGALKSFELHKAEVNTVFRGRFYIFDVDAQYAKGRVSETVTLFSEVSAERPAIVSRVLKAAGR